MGGKRGLIRNMKDTLTCLKTTIHKKKTPRAGGDEKNKRPRFGDFGTPRQRKQKGGFFLRGFYRGQLRSRGDIKTELPKIFLAQKKRVFEEGSVLPGETVKARGKTERVIVVECGQAAPRALRPRNSAAMTRVTGVRECTLCAATEHT